MAPNVASDQSVPDVSDDRLDVSTSRRPFCNACQCRGVVNEEQDHSTGHLVNELPDCNPNGHDLVREDLSDATIQS